MSEKDLAKLCATLSPVVAEATYVYCSFPDFTLPAGLLAFRQTSAFRALPASSVDP